MNAVSVSSVELLLAVSVASFLGSLHCVGMCGPFALMATGTTRSKAQMATRLSLYHLGRLTTYLIAGVGVGIAGTLLTSGGQWLGIQSGAARIAGGLMVIFGIAKLIHYAGPTKTNFHHLHGLSQKISAWLASLRPMLSRMQAPTRAFASGMLTTLLPCGWLYLFLLVAGGTGAIASATALMFAFWIGSIPALTGLVFGAQQFAPRFKKILPMLGGILLVVTGMYTAIGRASADLSKLNRASQQFSAKVQPALDREALVSTQTPNRLAIEQIDALKNEPLPCCQLRESLKKEIE